eukprot:TRINITY_DN3793_c4_g1_i1.p1 TRINITY_DN3793_c4_g1~~TRINITY_DN3793_c4_g1_i1.p1  ORF type:complete len:113 (-),score=12.21 TRINITY_DN3793_c4_g1_i1:9-347(-)
MLGVCVSVVGVVAVASLLSYCVRRPDRVTVVQRCVETILRRVDSSSPSRAPSCVVDELCVISVLLEYGCSSPIRHTNVNTNTNTNSTQSQCYTPPWTHSLPASTRTVRRGDT